MCQYFRHRNKAPHVYPVALRVACTARRGAVHNIIYVEMFVILFSNIQ